MVSLGLEANCIFQLHGEMDEEAIDRTKRPTGLAGCILPTSKGEKALTIADVDHVIDSGIDRTSAVDKEVVDLFDMRSPQPVSVQRASRAGRVKRGSYAKIVPSGCPSPPDGKSCSMDSVMQVNENVAFENLGSIVHSLFHARPCSVLLLVVDLFDMRSSPPVSVQRAGRAGRVKRLEDNII